MIHRLFFYDLLKLVKAYSSETACRDYLYDGVSRLTKADMTKSGDADDGSAIAYTYDHLGNITSITDTDSTGETSVLSMVYDGNKLSTMTHRGQGQAAFLNGPQYSYDSNGNMTSDLNSGITAMSYDRLNLPESITVNMDGQTTHSKYIHDSGGAKLRVTSERSLAPLSRGCRTAAGD